ncbi:hypothetical protein [Pseudomonas sp. NBRC 111124]|uniref:hypothetical protein n=1 Tax=Pseudomonas sp. NBRC 111124 TaxID=1661039 RepID=UPI002108CF57|nr:hypothetical protein [Pseudomonas sp. NBRC 111124]
MPLLTMLALVTLLVASLAFGQWPDYARLVASLDEPLSRLRWIVGDISEVAFYKHELPALGMLLGACLAHWAHVRGYRWQGFAICYASGLWPWLFASSLLGLMLSHVFWGWTLASGTWQPTFVAFVSLPAAMVLLFGGGWRVTLSGALFGALLVTPACLLLVNYLCYPLQLPVVIGNVSGMALASLLAFGLCKRFPVLVRDGLRPCSPGPVTGDPDYGVKWVLRRVLADFSEAPFFGNELASLGLLLGVMLAYALAPSAPAYGSQLLLPIIAGQALASLIGVLLWLRQWRERGWYPTYIPIVSIVPASVLTLGGDWQVVISSAVLGALFAPPLAATISQRLPGYMHGYIGNVISMAVCTAGIVSVLGLIMGAEA